MWIRGLLALLVVVLTACGQSDPPGPGEPVDVSSLQNKLRAMTSDVCYTDPGGQPPHLCEKFVTQVGNVASTIAQSARTNLPQLEDEAESLTESIATYRNGECDRARPASESDCVDALTELADAMDGASDALNEIG